MCTERLWLVASICKHSIYVTESLLFDIYSGQFGDFVDRIYQIEFEIKVITDTAISASYLDISKLTAKGG